MLYRLCLNFQGYFGEIPAFAGMTDCTGVQLDYQILPPRRRGASQYMLDSRFRGSVSVWETLTQLCGSSAFRRKAEHFRETLHSLNGNGEYTQILSPRRWGSNRKSIKMEDRAL